ncbi:hypothetical protein KUV50_14355 [Membranicola marinus]|uniref:Septum formation initiator n=1 Tax=Membranihabitans marinus TaxID=1227546 RepID=A0A953HW96_9BACT|nr:hypothetical protein [Membranihabitans marinus]MBY5959331.1 hypothetical protein [Membranihabitans marinus]
MKWITNSYGRFLSAIPPVFLNKYVVAAMAFLVWMIFFDQNKLTRQIELTREINELERNKEYYTEEIEVVKEARADLNNNLEKFAREKYFLKKSDEDVFIIEKN